MTFFLETLDSHGCIPIAFKTAAPYEMSAVGATTVIQDIGEDIMAKTKSMLEKSLSRDSIKEAKEIAIENSTHPFVNGQINWMVILQKSSVALSTKFLLHEVSVRSLKVWVMNHL
jgi:hypothetical protein